RLKVTTPGEGLTISVMKRTQASELQETLYYEKEKLEAIDEEQAESTNVIDEEVDETGEVSSTVETKSEPKERELLYAMTGRMLVLMAMTSGALGTFLAIILGIFGSFSGVFIEEIVERYFDVFENFIRVPVIAISVAAILFIIFAYV